MTARDPHTTLKSLVEHSPDYLYVVSLDGRIRYANRASPPRTAESVFCVTR